MARRLRTRPGIYEIPADFYHDDPCKTPSLSSSIAAELIHRSPLHAWTKHPRLNPEFKREAKTQFDIGTAAHSILLDQREPEDIVEVIHADDWKTKAAREERDAARVAGKVPLLAHQLEDVVAMVTAAQQQLAAFDADPPLLGPGKPERTLIWREDKDVLCRARLDWLHDDHSTIDDYKTTAASAEAASWSRRTLFSIGADVQTVFYKRGMRAITERDVVMRYIVQENYPPYELSVVTCGEDVLTVARDEVERAIATWRRCLTTNQWPGYPKVIASAELPSWEESRYLERRDQDEWLLERPAA